MCEYLVKMKRGVYAGWLLVVLCSVVVLMGCERRGGDGVGEGKPVVVATIWPLADLARQICGDEVEVVCLVPAGVSPHGFDPTGRQMEAVVGARLVIGVGLGFDRWVEGLVEGEELFEFEETMEGVEHEDDEDHAGETAEEHAAHLVHGEDEHDHRGVNPHVWLDPILVIEFVKALGDRLAVAAPEAAEGMKGRVAKLVGEIEAIDEAYKAGLGGVDGVGGGKIVTFHNGFDRLAARYGVEVVATLGAVESPGALTAARIEEVIEAVEVKGVRAVFAEPQFPADAGGVIEQEVGVKVLMLDPLGDRYVEGRSTYQEMMRFNLKVLMEGLGR